MSGFRAGPGGGQELFGVTPDLATLAKAMANGFVISAVAGRRDLMGLIGGGPVIHPGTYNGNVCLSMAAAVATLTTLQEGTPYETIERAGGRLIAGFCEALGPARHQERRPGRARLVQRPPRDRQPVESLADTMRVDGAQARRLTLAPCSAAVSGRSRAATGTSPRPTPTPSSTRRSTSSRTP